MWAILILVGIVVLVALVCIFGEPICKGPMIGRNYPPTHPRPKPTPTAPRPQDRYRCTDCTNYHKKEN